IDDFYFRVVFNKAVERLMMRFEGCSQVSVGVDLNREKGVCAAVTDIHGAAVGYGVLGEPFVCKGCDTFAFKTLESRLQLRSPVVGQWRELGLHARVDLIGEAHAVSAEDTRERMNEYGPHAE